MEYTGENIDRLLFERHLGQKARRAGKRSAAVKKRTAGDDEAFRAALCPAAAAGLNFSTVTFRIVVFVAFSAVVDYNETDEGENR